MLEPRPEPILWNDDPPVCGVLAHGVPIDAHFHDYGQLRFAASGALVTATKVFVPTLFSAKPLQR